MTDESTGGLSAAEEAYFASGGTAEITTEPAPVAEPAPAPSLDPVTDPAAVIDQGPQDRDEKGRFVPHQALHAEREEHKKTRSELQTLREQQAILNDRWNTLLAATKQPEQQPEAPPNPEEDIFAYAKWQGDQIKALTEKVEGRDKAETEARTAAEQERELWGHWSQSAQAYAATAPDFGDAVKFLSDARTKQLNALAVVDPNFSNAEGVTNQINAELKAIVASARARGENPAKVVHDIAKAYGFAGAAPSLTPTPAPAAAELAGKIAQIDAAQTASRTLAAAPGRDAGDPMSPEAIAAMSTSEFDAWMKSPENAKLFQKMMGG